MTEKLLTLAMIVRNEEQTLGRILSAARQFCDEMVVVDTGSTDKTVEIAQAHGARTDFFPWCDDFAFARNYSFGLATTPWICWFDADDVLDEGAVEIGKRIRHELLPVCDKKAVFAPYEYAYAEDGSVQVFQNRERFVRRGIGLGWQGKVHECIAGIGTDFHMVPEFRVQHRPVKLQETRKEGRNLKIFESYINLDTATLRELYLYGNELRGAKKYTEAVPIFRKYLERTRDVNGFDLFSEPYMVRVDLAASLRELRLAGDVLRACGDAIAYDATRAEAYVLMALTHYEAGDYRSAFPLFLAGAACKKPTHGGLVYQAFYGPVVRDMIQLCKDEILKTETKEAQNATQVGDLGQGPVREHRGDDSVGSSGETSRSGGLCKSAEDEGCSSTHGPCGQAGTQCEDATGIP